MLQQTLRKCKFIFSLVAALVLTSTVNAQNFELNKQQLHEFFHNGIVIIPHFFTKEEVAQTLTASKRLEKVAANLAKTQTGKLMYNGTQIVLEPVQNKNELLRVVWGGAAEPELLKLARQPKLLIPVSQILNSDKADQLNNQLHFKYPNGGADLTFYQDIRNRKRFDENWRDLNGNGSFVLCTIALEPMNEQVGTIYYVPRSHTRGDLELDKITDPAQLQQVAQLQNAVALTLNPGDLVMWHPYLIHGKSQPAFATERRLFINGFAYPGANTKPYPGEGSAQTIDLK